MKKLTKLAAVFAALLLALSCFVACSNGSDTNEGGNGGSGNGGNDGSTSAALVNALQGLWIAEEAGGEGGYYFVGSTMYLAFYEDGKYYYFGQYPMSFSVSGDKIVTRGDGETFEMTFKINGNTATVTDEDETMTLKKVDATPTE